MLPHPDATGLAPNEKRPTLLQISPGENLSWPVEDRNISYFIPSETWWPWCDYWKDPQHIIFHLAYLIFLIGYASNGSKASPKSMLFMHVSVIIGLILICTWAWNVICAPDVFTWNFSFMFLNIGQIFYIIYAMRPVRFDPELEEVYQTLFAPFKISRLLFKRMVSSEFAQIMSLHAGEAYAMQNLTRTDRLGLLLSGKVNVLSDHQFLHPILPCEFLDSPEFESSRATVDDKFKVSIVAASTCRYIYWQRTALEYLFVKETYLATVLSTLIARDITTKLYAMNNKIVTEKGSHLDIRLPSITSLTSGGDFKSPSKKKFITAMGPLSPDSLLSGSSRERAFEGERRRENGVRISEMTPLTELPSCDELADVQHWLDTSSKYHSCEYVDID